MINTEGDGHERVLRKGRYRFLGHVDCHWSVQLDNNSAVNERQNGQQWEHMVGAFEFTRIAPTILPKKNEDLREAGAKAIPSVGAQAMRTLLGSGRPSARRDQLRPVSPDK